MTRTDTAAVKQSYADYVEGYPEDAPVRRGPAAASLTVTTAVIAGDTAYMTGLRGDETVTWEVALEPFKGPRRWFAETVVERVARLDEYPVVVDETHAYAGNYGIHREDVVETATA